MGHLLRLRPFRRIAFMFIDTNVFRHALEERLKRQYIVRGPDENSSQLG